MKLPLQMKRTLIAELSNLKPGNQFELTFKPYASPGIADYLATTHGDSLELSEADREKMKRIGTSAESITISPRLLVQRSSWTAVADILQHFVQDIKVVTAA